MTSTTSSPGRFDTASSLPGEHRTCRVDISRIARYAPSRLIGREAELGLLADVWAKMGRDELPRPRVISLVAPDGEGKTSLVAKWAAGLAAANWPGCEAAFAWSFHRQGTSDQIEASSDWFVKEALTFFGDPEMAGSAQTPFAKCKRLAQLVGERRALLILDRLEPLQFAPTSSQPVEPGLRDQGIAALLKALAANSRGLCVVTTRYSISDLRAYWQSTAPEIQLPRLSQQAGVALLRSLGLHGRQKDVETLVEDVKGHALTLNLLGTYLRDAHEGDVHKRELVKLEHPAEQGGQTFPVMDALVAWFQGQAGTGQQALALLQLLGLFDRPMSNDCLAALKQAPAIPGLTDGFFSVQKRWLGLGRAYIPIDEAQWTAAYSRLEAAKLITMNRDASGTLLSVETHPLLREYFARRLREEHPEAWRGGHRRLYENLCTTTKDKPEPTLEDMQPLYQAVAHGCQAGMQQEACQDLYCARIFRVDDPACAIDRLGAFGAGMEAVICFFEQPWSRASPSISRDNRFVVLNATAFLLRALGRLREAIEARRAAMEIAAELDAELSRSASGYPAARGAAMCAAGCAYHLCDLELMSGDVAGAVRDSEQAVAYSFRSGDSITQIMSCAALANALHHSGRRDEAKVRFREAEIIQDGLPPSNPLVFSTFPFQHCDLLLVGAERTTWALSGAFTQIESPSDKPAANDQQRASSVEAPLQSCAAVSQRAAKIVEWLVPGDSLLDIPLDLLTLGRAALYASILDPHNSQIPAATSHINSAVDGLRSAGKSDDLPRGLLTRAWLRFLTGARTGPESAQADLDEAWEIAERGPMPLFQADIHLHRTRLFHAVTPYPWPTDIDGRTRGPKDDIAAARQLIEKHGYWRRKEELEDAEEAAKRW
jgi:tetratricopeptide (TPR) repeat protein